MPPCAEVLALVGGKLASVLDDYDADHVRTLYTEDTRHMIPRTGSEAVSYCVGDDHIHVYIGATECIVQVHVYLDVY